MNQFAMLGPGMAGSMPAVVTWVFIACAAAGLAYWLLNLILAVRVVRCGRVLAELHPREPAEWPKVSVIIPACNEAQALETAVRSRLADDYPALELILIDDRSTDATGAIVNRLAAVDPRVRAVHVRELPAGWLGKVHALHRGTELATGEWLLYSDADVHVQPGTLRRVIAYAIERELDHVAVFPELWHATFWLDVLLAGFVRVLALGARLWAIEDPKSGAAMGVGAFNLVRRSTYERTAGFEWMRLEIVDDATLGQMLKSAGGRAAALNGRELVGLKWYSSVMDMARGAEKSVFGALGQFSLVRLLAVCLGILMIELAPFIGLAGVPLSDTAVRTPLVLLGILGAIAAVAAQIIPWRWMNGRWLPALFVPVATVLAVALTIRSGWLAVRRGGLLWRGTLYPTDVLRAGARFRFP